jgi:hypothetical protein
MTETTVATRQKPRQGVSLPAGKSRNVVGRDVLGSAVVDAAVVAIAPMTAFVTRMGTSRCGSANVLNVADETYELRVALVTAGCIVEAPSCVDESYHVGRFARKTQWRQGRRAS